MFCGCDGIGRHARFRFLCVSVWVRVPSSAYIRSSPAQLRAGLFSYMRRGSPRTHGFSVSSAQSAFVGRFGGKMVHQTIFCFRLTLHPLSIARELGIRDGTNVVQPLLLPHFFTPTSCSKYQAPFRSVFCLLSLMWDIVFANP